MKNSLIKTGILVIVPIRFLSLHLFYFPGQKGSGSNNAGTVSDNAGRSENAGLGRDNAMLVLDDKMQVPENNNAGP